MCIVDVEKGIPADVIDAALDNIDEQAETDAAKAYAERALRGESDYSARNRAYGALQRRGYTGDIIRRAIALAIEETENATDLWD